MLDLFLIGELNAKMELDCDSVFVEMDTNNRISITHSNPNEKLPDYINLMADYLDLMEVFRARHIFAINEFISLRIKLSLVKELTEEDRDKYSKYVNEIMDGITDSIPPIKILRDKIVKYISDVVLEFTDVKVMSNVAKDTDNLADMLITTYKALGPQEQEVKD